MKKISLFGRELTTKTIAALAVISVVAIAATYTVTQSILVTAQEPFSTTEVTPATITLYPGETKTVQLHITNDAPVTYGIVVTVTPSITGDCSWEGYQGVEGSITAYDAANNKFNIATGDGYINYGVSLPANADGSATCTIDLSYSIERQAEFTSG